MQGRRGRHASIIDTVGGRGKTLPDAVLPVGELADAAAGAARCSEAEAAVAQVSTEERSRRDDDSACQLFVRGTRARAEEFRASRPSIDFMLLEVIFRSACDDSERGWQRVCVGLLFCLEEERLCCPLEWEGKERIMCMAHDCMVIKTAMQQVCRGMTDVSIVRSAWVLLRNHLDNGETAWRERHCDEFRGSPGRTL